MGNFDDLKRSLEVKTSLRTEDSGSNEDNSDYQAYEYDTVFEEETLPSSTIAISTTLIMSTEATEAITTVWNKVTIDPTAPTEITTAATTHATVAADATTETTTTAATDATTETTTTAATDATTETTTTAATDATTETTTNVATDATTETTTTTATDATTETTTTAATDATTETTTTVATDATTETTTTSYLPADSAPAQLPVNSTEKSTARTINLSVTTTMSSFSNQANIVISGVQIAAASALKDNNSVFDLEPEKVNQLKAFGYSEFLMGFSTGMIMALIMCSGVLFYVLIYYCKKRFLGKRVIEPGPAFPSASQQSQLSLQHCQQLQNISLLPLNQVVNTQPAAVQFNLPVLQPQHQPKNDQTVLNLPQQPSDPPPTPPLPLPLRPKKSAAPPPPPIQINPVPTSSITVYKETGETATEATQPNTSTRAGETVTQAASFTQASETATQATTSTTNKTTENVETSPGPEADRVDLKKSDSNNKSWKLEMDEYD